MFILTVNDRESDGAYSVADETGENVLYIWEKKDDAVRFAMMLENDGSPEMRVIEIENDMMIKTCEMNDCKYAIFSENDFVIPPKIKHDFI